MTEEERAFVDDCGRHADLEWVKKHRATFPVSFNEIIDDNNGEEVLAAGVGIFAYLADLVAQDFEEGMKAWRVIYEGYEGYPYTDLFIPYSDVVRTRQLWLNAVDNLQSPPIVKGEMILNVYFRWYISAVEFARKMLIYAAFCRNKQNGLEFNVAKSLFHGRDPVRSLQHAGLADRAAVVTRFYKPELRHAIAHGHIALALPHVAAVYLSDDARAQLIPHVFDFSSDQNVVENLQERLQRNTDPMYQATRVFFFLQDAILQRHMSSIKQHMPATLTDPVFAAVVSLSKDDPDGMRDWPTQK